MARTNTCDVCGRTVTITISRGEYVTGLQGYEYADGTVRCEGNRFGSDGACITQKDGEIVEVEA